ncbi:peptidylprolyl isomerase [Clostridium perfringens]|uniref:peptidylprolyl isomerase n=1 Tax=Clostridium perfringens TaxID=1502 RepID=UPI0039ED94DA
MSLLKKVSKIVVGVTMASLLLIGCGGTGKKAKENIPEDKLPVATIEVKNFGTIEAELYPNKAPNTVDNFISLANSGFYDGLTIHRIVKGFVLQGGDPKGTGTGGPGYMIKGEISSNGVENDIKHEEGILSMARSQNPDSAGSQFFIVTKEAPHLDGQYAAFGKVTKGLDVVHEIEKVSVGANDKPVEDVVIESIKVDTKGIEYKEPEKVK